MTVETPTVISREPHWHDGCFIGGIFIKGKGMHDCIHLKGMHDCIHLKRNGRQFDENRFFCSLISKQVTAKAAHVYSDNFQGRTETCPLNDLETSLCPK